MRYVVSLAEMRQAEEICNKRGISYLTLMEQAGTVCAHELVMMLGDTVKQSRVAVLCGKGNNGGDGIVIASHLSQQGAIVTVVFAESLPVSETAKACFEIHGQGLNWISTDDQTAVKEAILSATLIVDAVYGTGFRGELPQNIRELFSLCRENESAVRVSIDIPSGINGDSGKGSDGSFIPHVTMCLGAMKQGMILPHCADVCGSTVLLDIGIPNDCYPSYQAVLSEGWVKGFFPERKAAAHKGDFGKSLIIAGSRNFPGAAVLAAKGAMRIGSGLTVLASVDRVVSACISGIPECIFETVRENDDGGLDAGDCIARIKNINGVTAIGLGCGMMQTKDTAQIAEYVIKTAGCPIVLDADGINAICPNIYVLKDSGGQGNLVLTPHPKEFSRLIGVPVSEIQQNRMKYAKQFAVEYGVVLVLKGMYTVIALPSGNVFVNTSGNNGLSKGGSGDVLLGILTGLCAQGLKPWEAAVLGVYVHGLCAEMLGEKVSLRGILASDIAETLPFVMD